MGKSTLIATFAISLAAAYLGMRFGMVVALHPSFYEGFMAALDGFVPSLLANPLAASAGTTELGFAFAGFLGVWCFWAAFLSQPNNFRAGEEHGSSRWATRCEGQLFLDKKTPSNNIIFSQNYGMALSHRKFNPKRYRNLNTLVLGGSGSGKTRRYVIPNLLNANANFFVTDPKGGILPELGYFLEEEGYEIKVFNTIEWDKSLHYNPLYYVKTDAEIESFVNCLCMNLTDKDAKGGDPFWSDGEKLLYSACLRLLRDWFDDADYTLAGLLYLLDLAKVKEEDEDYQSALDLMFKQVETGFCYTPCGDPQQRKATYDEAARGLRPGQPCGAWEWKPSPLVHKRTGIRPADVGGCPNDGAVRVYRKFKQGAGKTMKSFLITCGTHLNRMDNDELLTLLGGAPDSSDAPTGRCELELDRLGDADRKIIVFGIVSDTDSTFHFIFTIMMWQAINVLCNRALEFKGQRLPRPVHLIFDEFGNIGTLPDFNNVITVTRSRNIFATLILQSIPQLAINYGEDEAEVIRDNCDTMLFLGGTNAKTNDELSERIGDQTIDEVTSNQTKGGSASYTKNYQKVARRLIDAAEIGRLDVEKALVLISHTYPLQDEKYALEKHPQYKRTASASGKPEFDYAKYLKKTRESRNKKRGKG